MTVADIGSPGYNGDNILVTNAKVNDISGFKCDGRGDIYFFDCFRIRKVTVSTGMITTIAGSDIHGCN